MVEKNSGRGLPPLFGQCPKDNIFLQEVFPSLYSKKKNNDFFSLQIIVIDNVGGDEDEENVADDV